MRARRRAAALVVAVVAAAAVPALSPAPARAQGAPLITVTPSTDVVPGQSLTIAGSGLPPSATVSLLRCGSPSGGPEGRVCDYSAGPVTPAGVVTSPDGRFTVSVPAGRQLASRGPSWDCAAGPACTYTFTVAGASPPEVVVTVPVSFRRVGPLRMHLEPVSVGGVPIVAGGARCASEGALARDQVGLVVCAGRPARWVPGQGWRDPAVASLARLYATLLLRPLDAGALSAWVPVLARGVGLATVAGAIAASPELRAKEGALSDEQFVRVLYRNTFGRSPDPAGLAHWLRQLPRGRGIVALAIADSPEARALYAG